MKFAAIFTALAAVPAAFAATVSVSYDQTYDKGSNSLTTVACSDGSNGMLTKGTTPLFLNSLKGTLNSTLSLSVHAF